MQIDVDIDFLERIAAGANHHSIEGGFEGTAGRDSEGSCSRTVRNDLTRKGGLLYHL